MILLVLALIAADPTMTPASAPPPPPPPVVVAKPADDMDKIVCHADPETGTRLATHKECHTKREWALIQNENRNSLDQGTALGHPH
jgi:hypothetical protein